MLKAVTEKDFRVVKAKQNRGWSEAAAAKHTKWSLYTIRRIYKSRSFSAYKELITKETKKAVGNGKKYKHSNAAGSYETTPIGETRVTLRRPGVLSRLFGPMIRKISKRRVT